MPAELCGLFTIVFSQIIAESCSSSIMNHPGNMLKLQLQIMADIGRAQMANSNGIIQQKRAIYYVAYCVIFLTNCKLYFPSSV